MSPGRSREMIDTDKIGPSATAVRRKQATPTTADKPTPASPASANTDEIGDQPDPATLGHQPRVPGGPESSAPAAPIEKIGMSKGNATGWRTAEGRALFDELSPLVRRRWPADRIAGYCGVSASMVRKWIRLGGGQNPIVPSGSEPSAPAANTTEIGDHEYGANPSHAAAVLGGPEPQAPAAPIADEGTRVRKRRAIQRTMPINASPGVSTITRAVKAVTAVEAHLSGTEETRALSATVKAIMQQQQQRRYAIKVQIKLNNMLDDLIASSMGYRIQQTEKERRAVFDKATAFRQAIEKNVDLAEKGKPTSDPPGATKEMMYWEPNIVANKRARENYDKLRDQAEAMMEKLVVDTPVWPFVRDHVRGLGAKGLAVIVAEAGQPRITEDIRGLRGLGDYFTIAGLWNRLGYAVIDGRSQRKRSGKEEGLKQGYSPSRHAEIWAFCDDVMFRSQWLGQMAAYRKAIAADVEAAKHCEAVGIDPAKVKDLDDLREIAAPFGITATEHPLGPYGAVYGKRLAVTSQRIVPTEHLGEQDKWTPMRCSRDARRVMTKALIVDLWRVWNGKPPKYAGRPF